MDFQVKSKTGHQVRTVTKPHLGPDHQLLTRNLIQWAHLVICLEDIGEELVTQWTELDRAIVRHIESDGQRSLEYR